MISRVSFEDLSGLFSTERLTLQLLWAFNVEPQKDVYGNFVPIDDFRYTSGFSSHPKDFQAVITPRFAGVEEIIRLQAEELLE